MTDEETALQKAIHGYLRSAMYRRQGKKEPNRNLSSVERVDKLGGIAEFTVMLRADNGTELRQFVYRLLPGGDWERVGDDGQVVGLVTVSANHGHSRPSQAEWLGT